MKHYYSPYTGEQIITDTPAPWMESTEVAPTQQGMFFKEGAWVDAPVEIRVNPRIAEIKAELAAIDIKRIRPVAEGDIGYLDLLNKQAVALRAELRGVI